MIALALLAQVAVASSPSLGIAQGRCRPNEPGPALLVSIHGLRDRQGAIKLEVYPSNDRDFLADDNVLVNAGKVFRRVYEPVPRQGAVQLCIRLPLAGTYSLLAMHDRDSDHRFGMSVDGIGFAGNPRLGWTKPRAEAARVVAGSKLTSVTIVMNYRRGLAFRPLDGAK